MKQFKSILKWTGFLGLIYFIGGMAYLLGYEGWYKSWHTSQYRQEALQDMASGKEKRDTFAKWVFYR